MRKLILHIGGARTGSTSIQTSLAGARHGLSRLGILYPTTGLHCNSHHPFAWAIRERGSPGITRVPPLPLLLDQLTEEIAGSRCHTTILSSDLFEKLCNSPDRHATQARLRKVLDLFDDVRIMHYVRHQVPLMESWYRFVVKWFATAETADFATVVRQHVAADSLNPLAVRRFFVAARDDVDYELLSYRQAQRSRRLVRYFCDHAGMGPCQLRETKANASLGRAGTLAVVVWNRGRVPRSMSRPHFVEWARRAYIDDGSSLYDKALYEEVTHAFAECNREFMRECGIDLESERIEFESTSTLAGGCVSREFEQLLVSIHQSMSSSALWRIRNRVVGTWRLRVSKQS